MTLLLCCLTAAVSHNHLEMTAPLRLAGSRAKELATAMILIFLRDGTNVEIPNAFDVVHKSGSIACIDPWGELIESFSAEDVLAYSLNPRVVQEFSADPDRPDTKTPERRERVGQASEKVRISSQDMW